MFFNDTVVSVMYYVYKLLVEIASNKRGYTIATQNGGRRTLSIPTEEGAICRFVYQTLRVFPISRLYSETNTPKDGPDRDILWAIAKLYSHETRSLQEMFYELELRGDDIHWADESRAKSVLEAGLMADILQDAEAMVPKLFNGEPVLTMYAKLPQMRTGLWNRYKKSYPRIVREHPEVLEALELDWYEWSGTINIDPERADSYVAESVMGQYMGAYFFKSWNSEVLPQYTQNRQRVMYEGSVLDTSNLESVALREDPVIDFHQAMTDITDLSMIMFRHSTAQNRDYRNLSLQYSVLEWYTEKYFQEHLRLLNAYYRNISQGKFKWSKGSAARVAMRSGDVLRLFTTFGVKRLDSRSIDNTLLERIRNNRDFLNEMYDRYREIDTSNITETINRYMVGYLTRVARDKRDSNYPFFKENEDVIQSSDASENSLEMKLLYAMHPGLTPDVYSGKREAMSFDLLTKGSLFIVTDKGYRKMALLLRTMKALDDLSVYLANHDMSIADLDSVNYLDNRYFAMVDDLEGVLYNRLNRVWSNEHTVSDSSWKDLYDDGVSAQTVGYISNADVRKSLAIHKQRYESGDVNLQALSDSRVVSKVKFSEYSETIELLRETRPSNYALDAELNAGLTRLCTRFCEECMPSAHVTKYDIYAKDKTLQLLLWEQTVKFMKNFSVKNLVVMLGDFILMMDIQRKMTGAQSKPYRDILERLDLVSNVLKINTVRLLDQLTNKGVPIIYSDFSEMFGTRLVQSAVYEENSKAPKFSFVFENLMVDLETNAVTYGGTVIGASEMGKAIDAINLRYRTATGFDSRISAIEGSFKGRCVSITTLCLMYFLTVSNVIDCYLQLFLPVDSGMHSSTKLDVCDFWAKRDKVFAKRDSLTLIRKIHEDHITQINGILTAYNNAVNAKSPVYKTYAALALSKALGSARDLKQFVLSLLKLYQDLKAGVPQEELLAEFDQLQIEYTMNVKAHTFLDTEYDRMMFNVILAGACEWIQTIQIPAGINAICDRLLNIKSSLLKDLSLDKTLSKRYTVGDRQELYAARLQSVMSDVFRDPSSELAMQLRTLTIAAGNRADIERRIRQIVGMPSSMLLSDERGFLKNLEGKYYNAKIGENDDVIAFLRRDGVVCICNMTIDNTHTDGKDGGNSVKFVLISGLSDELQWSGAEN